MISRKLSRKATATAVIGGCLLFSCTTFAAPQITQIRNSTVSGDVQYTVTGSGFRSGPTIALYDTFNQGTNNQVVNVNTATVGRWLRNTSPYFKSYLTDEMGFAANRMPYGADYENRIGTMVASLPVKANQIFVSYSIYLPPGATFSGASATKTWPSVPSWKMAWAMDTEGGFGNDGRANIILPNSNGNGNFAIDGNAGDLLQSIPPATYRGYTMTPSSPSAFKNYWDWDHPNSMAFMLKPDAANLLSTSGEIYWRIANSQNKLTEQSITNVVAALTGTSMRYDIVNFPGWWGNGDSANFQAIYDNVYIAYGSNVKARVELTDSATYASSTKIYPVPYTQWTDTQIVVSTKAINLKNIDNMYLYVTDASGVRSTTPIKLCATCASTAVPPSAPPSVTVQQTTP
jgi:hypothetical protein